MMKKDSGATEVLGFIIIISIVIIGILLWVLIAVPIQGENSEITHNDEVLLEMASLKYDIDTLMENQIWSTSRTALISCSPRGDKTKVTLLPDLSNVFSSGTITIEPGDPLPNGFSRMKITFTSTNTYAENIEIVYDGGSLAYAGKQKVLSEVRNPVTNQELVAAVPSTFAPMKLSGNEFVIITFKLDTQYTVGTQKIGVFSLDMRSSYNG